MTMTDHLISVPGAISAQLAGVCSLATEGHRWSAGNVAAARRVLADEQSRTLIDALTERVSRRVGSAPGWAVLELPDRLGDEDLQRAAAGVLAALGRPFFSIDVGGGRLWIGNESSPDGDAASFGGFGLNRLHIDAPNVEYVPDYTSLLVMRADPAGGGASVVGDLGAAFAELSDCDQAALARPIYFEGRAEGLHGVGEPRLPFPVLERVGGRRWIRWAAKMLDDPRNAGHTAALEHFAAALARHTMSVMLRRGRLLIADQQRIAHGRAALGDQTGLADGTRRWLVQAKVAYDAHAPAQHPAPASSPVGGRHA
ncbi:TauD/TfdA family dioxygenase [Actinoallomurus acaciae]|uniref:TauD/TfdA family dioxygenase n=1 Tax=Actinoallomurus acaciae TaxID=502577 RepID=A0ABV5YFX8_9ACTN